MKNNNPQLLLTVDYELFGDGSGCIEPCIIKPAEKIIKIADKYSAKVTFFVDAIEFIKMEQEARYIKGINQVKKQLADAFDNGHDIQLHVHPQWMQANYEREKWSLDLTAWRIADLDQKQILSVLKESKSWLENVVGLDKQYICNSFRAGGWCIQPSKNVVYALQETGIKVDSTVAPGFKNLSHSERSNFSKVPDKPYWLTNSDVCCEASSGIYEIPIATGIISRLKHLKVLKNAKKQGMAKNCVGSYQGPDGKYQTIKGKLGKLIRLGHVMLDFSTMSSEILVTITRQWIDKYSHLELHTPIVAIAHTKNFTGASEKALDDYLLWAKREELVFATYSDCLDVLND